MGVGAVGAYYWRRGAEEAYKYAKKRDDYRFRLAHQWARDHPRP
jgi:hypothetical protein